jgi:hypothetical protein
MFVLYSRNTIVRAYYDKYVDKKVGATLKEVATALGWFMENGKPNSKYISDAVFGRDPKVQEFKRIGKGRYISTDQYVDGWNAADAERVLEDHLSGRLRVDEMMARDKAQALPKGRARRKGRPGPEDWSALHFWEAVLKALEELGAIDRAHAKLIEDIKAKLAQHKVKGPQMPVGMISGLDLTQATLRSIANRLKWVVDGGGAPARWFLTEQYLALSIEDRKIILAQWDDKSEAVDRPTEPEPEPEPKPELEPIIEEEPVDRPTGNLVAIDNEVVVVHHFEWDGAPFGVLNAHVTVEARLPIEPPAEERLGLFQFIMKLREDLLNLI